MSIINCYKMDNMEFMKKVSDKYYDLAFPDPNYGLNASSPSDKPNIVKQKNGSKLCVKQSAYIKKDWDKEPAHPEFFDEIFRISKHQIIWGCNYYDYKFQGGRIVWDKMNGESDQLGCEIAFNSLSDRTDIIHYMWAGMFQGVTASENITKALVQIGNKKKNEKRIHQTQKPVILYKYILQKYVPKGFKIIDTNGGSFSLAIACWDLGYDLDIIEVDNDHYRDGVSRFNWHKRQQTINFPEL